MTKHNFYIITGGPGAGKTSVLENLALKGYSYIPETARQIIKERLSKGLPPRPDPTSFAQQIFAQDWKNFALNSSIPTLLFYDRSFMDSACMLFESNMESYNKVKGIHLANRYNNRVFITPPWKEIYRNDRERDQTFEQSIEVYKRLEKWYGEHGYEMVVLPKDTVENRAKFILSQVGAKT